ncbi:MAG: restriction endonuclease subunit S [Methylococcaceae bacterium]
MSKWREFELGKAIKTNETSVSASYPFEGIVYLDTGSITKGKINGLQKTSISDAPSRAKRLVKDGDVIYSTVRPIQRHYGFISNSPKNLVVSTGFVVISCDKEKLDSKFIYYYLTSDSIVEELDIIAEASTSTYPSIKPSDIEKLNVRFPAKLEEQKAIAAVLSSLDDKIDLLHRQNLTLEVMAETLFRQWFVVEARDDWEDGTLDDVISIKGGTTPSTKEPAYWDGDIYWTSPRDLSNHDSVFFFDTERKITEKVLAKIGSGLMPVGTVLLSSRAPIGYLTITDIPVAINQGYIAIVCDKLVSNYFMYLWCKSNMEDIKNAGNGSTFEEISKSNFKALALPIPPKQKLEEFDAAISPVFRKIRSNQIQIQTLEKLRDTLLPKLMSGEVRVTL